MYFKKIAKIKVYETFISTINQSKNLALKKMIAHVVGVVINPFFLLLEKVLGWPSLKIYN